MIQAIDLIMTKNVNFTQKFIFKYFQNFVFSCIKRRTERKEVENGDRPFLFKAGILKTSFD
jgi:hypothetical protein